MVLVISSLIAGNHSAGGSSHVDGGEGRGEWRAPVVYRESTSAKREITTGEVYYVCISGSSHDVNTVHIKKSRQPYTD